MSFFFKHELDDIEHSRRMYDVARRRNDEAFERAEMNVRLVVSSPKVLLTIFSIGAYKGATSDNPPSRRRQAIVTFVRTIFFNFIS